MDIKKQPGILCKNIILMSSSFQREEKYSEQNVRNQITFDQHIELSEDQKDAIVSLKISLSQKSADSKVDQLKIEATFAGIFQIDEKSANMTLDLFCENNAPAILVPYIRQHVHELTAKAALPIIILPPINITAIQKASR